MDKKKILVIHGPNLNMLGQREPGHYGAGTIDDINRRIADKAAAEGFIVDCFQSNSEGRIVDKIQSAIGECDALIINPAAYTHTSVAIRDAVLLLEIPVVEVHLSNIDKREAFRHRSLIADVVSGRISGFGGKGYLLALEAVADALTDASAKYKG